MNTIKLSRHERVIAVVPEFCEGPGWSNRLVNVHIVDYATNNYRVVYLQHEEQSSEMQKMFAIIENVHRLAISCVTTKASKK